MGKVRSIEEQKALYEEYKRGGLTTKKFCQENKISSRSIWLWRKKFEQSTVDETAGKKARLSQEVNDVKFYSVGKLKDFTNTDNLLKIILPNGVSIKAALSKKEIDLFLQELIKWR